MKIIENNRKTLNIEKGKVNYSLRLISIIIAFLWLFGAIWLLRLFFYRTTLDCDKPEPNQGLCIITVHDLFRSYTYKYPISANLKAQTERFEYGYLVILEENGRRLIETPFFGGSEKAQAEKMNQINYFFRNLSNSDVNELNIIDDYNAKNLSFNVISIVVISLIVNYAFKHYIETNYIFDKGTKNFSIVSKNFSQTKTQEYKLSMINKAILEEIRLNEYEEYEPPRYSYQTKLLLKDNSEIVLTISGDKAQKQEIINLINKFINW
ncbi:hypothetical protein [Geminocystis herdmanii]|uniref:hypothetical protein n=1 Tax=Geminocystis herdmanii TaxID=669359 RepID=UPI00034CA28F|nr:hypothetical protein [Geminocystis herdmanii]